MKPVTFPGMTTVLTAPQDWDAESNGSCADLPVQRRGNLVTSMWRPTWLERIAIVMGRDVELSLITGGPHPPVSITVGRYG